MAALRTMIILDPDLEADSSVHAKMPRPAHHSASTRLQRMPSVRTLSRFLREAQPAVRLRGQVNVLLTTDTTIRRLNRQFRGKNKATDVLSFPAEKQPKAPRAPAHGMAGDLAISIPTARRQAEGIGHPLGVEIKVLMLHGLLHLAGFDHEKDSGEMERRETKLRARFRLPHGLIERTAKGARR